MPVAIGRRELIAALGSAAAWPLAARAQQQAMPVVALVTARSAEASSLFGAAFLRGLNETGTIEGQNVTVEFHWLEGQYDRLPSLMADLVRHRVAVIAAPGFTAGAQARPKLRPRRSRSCSASPKTRSSWVLLPVSPDRAATRRASMLSMLR